MKPAKHTIQRNSSKKKSSTAINLTETTHQSSNQLLDQFPQSIEMKPPTFGQKLADRMASKVGSWGFLIGQTAVLTTWVGVNLTPGLPHWDESPFILLNLVFSFASAYTAPVVLMSQNRQSDEDRQNAMHNFAVNLQTAQNLQLLQQKLEADYSQKLDELTELIKQQATQSVQNTETTVVTSNLHTPNYVGLLPTNVAQNKEAFMLPSIERSLFTQSPIASLHHDDTK